MKNLVLVTFGCFAFASSAFAESATMTADALRNDMIVSSHNVGDSGTAIMLLLVAALVVFVMALNHSTGRQYYYYTMSDERLKTDIKKVGMKNGLPIYQFRYVGLEQHLFEGVMAQDVIKLYPDAVIETDNGMLAVDYAAIGLEPKVIQ